MEINANAILVVFILFVLRSNIPKQYGGTDNSPPIFWPIIEFLLNPLHLLEDFILCGMSWAGFRWSDYSTLISSCSWFSSITCRDCLPQNGGGRSGKTKIQCSPYKVHKNTHHWVFLKVHFNIHHLTAVWNAITFKASYDQLDSCISTVKRCTRATYTCTTRLPDTSHYTHSHLYIHITVHSTDTHTSRR